MSRIMRMLLAFGAGILLGALLLCFVVYSYPYAHQSRTEKTLASFGANETVESFFSDIPAHCIAATHGGLYSIDPFPTGMPSLDHPNLKSGFALIAKIRDSEGKVIGFATELETLSPESNWLKGLIMIDTYWSLIIPGRGSVHLYQTENIWKPENIWKLTKDIIVPALLSGKAWSGDWVNVNTLGPLPNGYGTIIGGSGEFGGVSGTFIEVGTFNGFSPEGQMIGVVELRLSFDRHSG